MIIQVLAFGLLVGAAAHEARPGATASDQPARSAALRFAIANGLEVPTGNLVVAIETNHGYAHPVPSKLTSNQAAQEALALARVLGPAVRTGSAITLLPCPEFLCRCSTAASVVLVGEVSDSGGVYVRIFSPPERDDALSKVSQ